MLSINTNLSSLIAQQSLSSSTAKLNQAIERMSTGFKINHAKDNAANHSISQNMQIAISSYDVAADNVAMGMDLVTTASDIISTMQNHASRLQALSTQARNGTYGAQSMSAINSEAAAIMAEINRLYSTAEYNNVSLFNREAYEIANHLPKAGRSGFIDESALTTSVKAKDEYNGFIEDPKTYTDAEVVAMTRVKDVSTFSSGQKYAIYTKEELEKLADYVNDGNDTSGVEFVLGADIDLSSISNWTPIGNYEGADSNKKFKGIFDGNGHLVKNLTIDSASADYQGLFGYVDGGAELKNIGIVNCNVKGKENVGGLAGRFSAAISNSYITGSVTGVNNVGGLMGHFLCDTYNATYTIEKSYANTTVTGESNVGGLCGQANSGPPCTIKVTDNYATGNVSGQNYVGGFAGSFNPSANNCYATGNVTGTSKIGGFAGSSNSTNNCYATGNVTGTNEIGGFAGSSGAANNCYATGNVTGTSKIGGFAGISGAANNCYATGNVTGTNEIGGFAGSTRSGLAIFNTYATGNVTGTGDCVGGFAGSTASGVNLIDCESYSQVFAKDTSLAGSLIGGVTQDVTIVNNKAINNLPMIGGYYSLDYNGGGVYTYNIDPNYDMSSMLAGISAAEFKNILTSLQVGVNSDSSCQIEFDTNFQYDLSSLEGNIASDEAFGAITEFINLLSERSTQLGAVQNRLDSALESIEVNLENLVSSRSTVRDTDIAEESSAYIRQQILQQASATLLATANQSPSIALQLI